MKKLFLFISLCCLLLTCVKILSVDKNETEIQTGAIIYLSGRVMDKDGNPMPNTIAKLIKTHLLDTTDALGYYQIIQDSLPSSLNKAAAADNVDSLQIIKEGQIITSLDIVKWIDTLPDVFVIQRDIYGSFSSIPTDSCIIKAIISGDNIPASSSKTAELWYNEPDQSYSGFVYFVYSTQLLHYSVYVNVYNKDTVFIGRGVKVDFTSVAGNIHIPSFDPNNADPIANAGNDTTVTINDSIRLHGSAIEAFGKIVMWEWSINGSGFIQTSKGDTAILAPADSNPRYLCILRVTDDKGKFAMDSVNVIISSGSDTSVTPDTGRLRVNAGNDTTAEVKGSIRLHGSAIGTIAPIEKWEWDAGNTGIFIQTTPDSNFTVVAPSSTNYHYPCILKVTDVKGNVAFDTVVIHVLEYKNSMVKILSKDSSFAMGQPGITEPVHRVSFTSDFWMDVTEVTQGEYTKLLGSNPSHFTGDPAQPVDKAEWAQAAMDCNARSKAENLDTVYSYTSISISSPYMSLNGLSIDMNKNGYRLPTEAEWEYACRAGTTSENYWGDKDENNYAWVNGSATHPVAGKLPNSFGLYDIIGNVAEWCQDQYGTYADSAQINPTGSTNSGIWVYRGGSFSGLGCSSSARQSNGSPLPVVVYVGFRVVLPIR